MLENKETMAFADQRMTEIIKEGLQLEQELTIEGLQKEVLLANAKTSQALGEKDAAVRDIQRY